MIKHLEMAVLNSRMSVSLLAWVISKWFDECQEAMSFKSIQVSSATIKTPKQDVSPPSSRGPET